MKRSVRKQINRSGTALCEICNEPNILVEHHIRGRKKPNANHSTNLAYVCGSCHNNIHFGILIVENKHLTSSGYTLVWHYYKDASLTGDDAVPHIY